jgi:hypothetical protein
MDRRSRAADRLMPERMVQRRGMEEKREEGCRNETATQSWLDGRFSQ